MNYKLYLKNRAGFAQATLVHQIHYLKAEPDKWSGCASNASSAQNQARCLPRGSPQSHLTPHRDISCVCTLLKVPEALSRRPPELKQVCMSRAEGLQSKASPCALAGLSVSWATVLNWEVMTIMITRILPLLNGVHSRPWRVVGHNIGWWNPGTGPENIPSIYKTVFRYCEYIKLGHCSLYWLSTGSFKVLVSG